MVRFGTFELDLAVGELRKNGRKVRVQEQPFQLLAALVEKPGEVVTREALKDRLWPGDTYVDFDRSLNTAASKLRDALGDSASSPRFIETLPRRGYRFLGSVQTVAAGEDGGSTVAPDSPVDGRARTASKMPPRERELVRRLRLAWFLVAVAALVALAVSIAYFSQPLPEPSEAPLRRFSITPPVPLSVSTGDTNVAISPNGRHIVYGSPGKGLLVQDLDRYQHQPRVLEGTEGARGPFWSPDSGFIAFVAAGGVAKVSVQAGPAIRLCELPPDSPDSVQGTWSPDGKGIVFGSAIPNKLYEVRASGGTPKPLFPRDEPEGSSGWPPVTFHRLGFLPPEAGSRVLLFTFERTMMIRDLETGRRERLGPGRYPVYSPSGHIVYQVSGAAYETWALPFSLKTLKATGDAFPLFEHSRNPTVAADQTLVYLDASSLGEQLVWLNRRGEKTGSIGQPQQLLRYPVLSPDGRYVAVAGSERSPPDIWVHEVDRGIKHRVTSSDHPVWRPIWSGSGEELMFSSNHEGTNRVYRKAADGTGDTHFVHETEPAGFMSDQSRDGRYILYDVKGSDIWYIEHRGGDSVEPRPFLATDFTEKGATFSPNGRWVAYLSDESGGFEVYVQRFPEGGGRERISQNGGTGQRWGRDGRKLYYVEGETLVEVAVEPGSEFVVGDSTPLFSYPGLRPRSISTYAQYDVSADGEGFVVRETISQGQMAIHVVQNWFAEFRDGLGEDK
jgi:DNA-binding winged helix-turn-helix (wHTH) protein/Tol biopolymer transport system component